MNLTNKRALVTGGCGFIGSNLAKALIREGWFVTIVDDLSAGRLSQILFQPEIDPNTTVYDIDSGKVIIDDFASDAILESIQAGSYDAVFHLAAIPRVLYSVENPSLTTDTNIGKTVKLLEACTRVIPGRAKPSFIFSSSSSVYGGADELPTHESYPTDPKSPYALQKRVIEDYLRVFYNLYGLRSVALRYFNVFGPGQYGDSPYSTAVSAWCHAIKNNESCRLDGDGTQSRDMTYVDNVVSANILAANAMLQKDMRWDGRAYNVGCGSAVTNNEILEFLKSEFGGRVIIKNAPSRQGDVKHTKANISRAKDELGYDPHISFWNGLYRTLQWWNL